MKPILKTVLSVAQAILNDPEYVKAFKAMWMEGQAGLESGAPEAQSQS